MADNIVPNQSVATNVPNQQPTNPNAGVGTPHFYDTSKDPVSETKPGYVMTGNGWVKASDYAAAPTVVTSDAARSDLNNIKSDFTNITQGMQTQSQNAAINNINQTAARAQQNQIDTNTRLAEALSSPLPSPDDSAIQTYYQADGTPLQISDNEVQKYYGGDITRAGLSKNLPGTDSLNADVNSNSNNLSTTNSSLTSGEQQIGMSTSDVQKAIDANVKTFQDAITSLQNGTFQLSPDDQAQVDALQAKINKQIAAQTIANKAYEGGTAVMQARSGTERYAGEYAMGKIKEAVDQGISKINDLEATGAEAIANLRQGLKDKDYQMIKDSYNLVNDSLKQKSDTIAKINDQVRQATLDAQKKQQDDIANAFKASDLDLATKKQMFDQAMSSNQFSAKQKQDIQDNYYKQLDYDLKKQQVAIQQGELALKQQQATTTDSTVLNGAIQTTVSGKQYIDSSQYKGKEYDAARAAAAAQGIPFISKESAQALSEVDQARLNQKTINDYVHNLVPVDAQGRVLAAPEMKLSKFLQTNDQIAAFDSFRSAAINTLRAVAGSKGLRINQAEIELSVQNDIPKLTDTLGTVNQKFQNINNLLNNVENSIVVADRSGLNGGGVQIQDPKTGEIKTFPAGTDTSAAEAAGYKVINGGKSKPLSQGANSSIEKIAIGGKTVQVSQKIANPLEKADADFFKDTGKHLAINEGLRSTERQAQLYAAYKSGKGGRAAPPGKSFHETGNAVDVANWKEAEPYLRKYGFKNNLADDKNHFSIGEFS